MEEKVTEKSVKIWWGSIGNGDILGVLFGDRVLTTEVARLMIDRMKQGENLSISRRQMRLFARELDSGKMGVKYSYHNFYAKLVRKLLLLGLVEKGMMWSPQKKTTIRVYQLKLQSIKERPPHSGFIRLMWQIAKDWNSLVLS